MRYARDAAHGPRATCVTSFTHVTQVTALGIQRYLEEPFNRFDGVIVTISLLDILITALHIDIGINTSVLRAFRLLRVFKLARSWKGLRMVLGAITSAISQLASLFALLSLLIFIFALLGMQVVTVGKASHAQSTPSPRPVTPSNGSQS